MCVYVYIVYIYCICCVYIYIYIYYKHTPSNENVPPQFLPRQPHGCHGSNERHEDSTPSAPAKGRPPPRKIDLDPPEKWREGMAQDKVILMGF